MSVIDWSIAPSPWNIIGPESAEAFAALASGAPISFPPPSKPLQCERCNREFGNAGALANHVAYKHKGHDQ